MKRSFSLILAGLLLVFLQGVVFAAEGTTYSKNGVSFNHPHDWKVSEDQEVAGERYIFVEGPLEAMFIVMISSSINYSSLDAFVKEFSEGATINEPGISMSKSSFSPVTRQLSTGNETGIQESFSVTVLDATVPHVRDYFSIRINSRSVYLISQMATEDISAVDPGMRLMFKTFKLK